ncbi:PAS domain S-box protein [Kineococcus sp. SYSU DK006]|uniref:PAS domain S-box protein n=1 Tax=Kineococcus sp. SYSU DK006 TaxID=3383127 RepID=UPI003D7F07DB
MTVRDCFAPAGTAPGAAARAAVFDAMSDAVLVADLDAVVLDCNAAAERLFGRPREVLVGSRPGEDSSGRVDVRRAAAIQAAVLSRGTWSGDVPFRTGDGRRRTAATTVTPLLGDGGEVVGTISIHRDVTDERRTAAALSEAEERWRLTLDGAAGGIALVALDGTYLRVNDALCRILGHPAERLTAMTFQELTHPDDLADDLEALAGLVTGELERDRRDKRYLHADGSTVWTSRWASLVSDPHTLEPLHFVVQVEDITARRQAVERLGSIIATANDAFVAIDARGLVTEWNQAAEHLFGFSRAESVGVPLTSLIVPPEAAAAHRDGVARVGAGGAPHLLGSTVRLTARHRDGRPLPVELTVWRPGTGTGECYAFVRDIGVRLELDGLLQARHERQEALIAAQLAIAAVELSPQEVMDAICAHALGIAGADGAMIEVLEGTEMVYRAVAGTAAPFRGMRLPVDGSISGSALREQRALVAADTSTDPRVDREACRRTGAASLLVVPLRHGGEVIGVLKAVSGERDRFGTEQLDDLHLLAAPFGAALGNARTLERVHRHASTDAVTGLANRSHALKELERALERQGRRGGLTAVVFCDLDRFKAVNDTRGHAVGDELLAAVAERLRGSVRLTDTPARFGGDEFLVVCDGLAAPDDVEVLARRLLEAVPAPYRLPSLPGEEVAVGVSVGVSVALGPCPAAELLQAADEAMYEAKRAGGAAFRVRHLPARPPAPPPA